MEWLKPAILGGRSPCQQPPKGEKKYIYLWELRQGKK